MSNLQLYNSQSRKKELFKPLHPPKVSMYVCGPTVYDYCHIGHARAYLVFDVLYRFLQNRGYQVTYVRNLTDVDDKIIHRAEKEKRDFRELSEFFTAAFQQDMAALGALSPNVQPKATEHIDGMIQLIQKLISQQHAYVVNGDVYFSVKSFKSYLALSGRKSDDLLAGARVEVNEQKRDPLDFALWKGARCDEPSWQSPWGQGRPGWHIECSVMSQQHLGTTIDIHGGGRDLIFPHHENERAQSEAAHGTTFVRTWLHNGFVTLDKEKMSKSLGNLVTIRDLLKSHHPEVIRHALISAHYRSPIEFSTDLLSDSQAALSRIYLFLQRAQPGLLQGQNLAKPAQETLGYFLAAMEDDLNTPKALAVIFDAVKEGNRLLDQGDESYKTFASIVLEMGRILGLLHEQPAIFLQGGTISQGVDSSWVEERLAARNQARQLRDFKLADTIRRELSDKGVILEDKPEGGTTWRLK